MPFQKGNKLGKKFEVGHKGYTYWMGKKRSEETIRKNIESHKGKHSSVATEFKKGRKVIKTPEWIKNNAESNKLFYTTERGIEMKKRISKYIKISRAKQIFPLKDSSIEVKTRNLLDLLKIEYIQHKYMDIEHAYQCDFFIPSFNLVLETDGMYWHNYPNGTEKDKFRTAELISKGFKVLRLWENEIKLMNEQQLKERIESATRNDCIKNFGGA